MTMTFSDKIQSNRLFKQLQQFCKISNFVSTLFQFQYFFPLKQLQKWTTEQIFTITDGKLLCSSNTQTCFRTETTTKVIKQYTVKYNIWLKHCISLLVLIFQFSERQILHKLWPFQLNIHMLKDPYLLH